ncbi:MAG: hypothetical protein V1886_01110 [archaeon]
MTDLEIKLEKEKREFMNSVKEEIDFSQFRKIDDLPNGDKFVHDLKGGYVIDGATGNVKGWRIRTGALGGPSGWIDAEYSWNGMIGPGGRRGLHPKPPIIYR